MWVNKQTSIQQQVATQGHVCQWVLADDGHRLPHDSVQIELELGCSASVCAVMAASFRLGFARPVIVSTHTVHKVQSV